MAIQSYRSKPVDGRPDGALLHEGDYASWKAGLEACAAAGIELPQLNARGQSLDGAELHGLQAPESDFTGASCIGIKATRAVRGRILNLAAASLGGVSFEGAELTLADLSCTSPGSLKGALTGSGTILDGCDLSHCRGAHAVRVAGRDIDQAVAIVAQGGQWELHAGRHGTRTLAAARAEFANEQRHTRDGSARYLAALTAFEADPTAEAKRVAAATGGAGDGAGHIGGGGRAGGIRQR